MALSNAFIAALNFFSFSSLWNVSKLDSNFAESILRNSFLDLPVVLLFIALSIMKV